MSAQAFFHICRCYTKLNCFPVVIKISVIRQIDIMTQICYHTCRCAVKVSSMIYDNSGGSEKPHLGRQLKHQLWAGRSRIRERSVLDKHHFFQAYFKNYLCSKACSELHTPHSPPSLWL